MIHERLLDIAIREFGLKGLEGASTRGIAAAAGTAMSSITYHYGGKEGLYLAAADRIAERMGAEIASVLELSDLISATEPDKARAGIHAILNRFADKLTDPRTESWSLFISREQMHPTEAFDRIYGGLMGQMLETLVHLVRVNTGVDDRIARMTTITLVGQVLMLRSSRASCLRLTRRDAIDSDFVAELKGVIASNADAILDALAREKDLL